MQKLKTTYRVILVLLLLLLAPAADTYAISGLGLGVKAGVVTDYDNPNLDVSDYEFDDLKHFGALIRFGRNNFHLEVSAEYYWDKEDFALLDETVEVKATDFSINLTGKYLVGFPLIKPFIGAGVGIHNFTYTYRGPALGFDDVTITIPDDEARFGFHIVVGGLLSLPMLPFDAYVEGKLGRVNTKQEATKYSIIAAGIVFNLP